MVVVEKGKGEGPGGRGGDGGQAFICYTSIRGKKQKSVVRCKGGLFSVLRYLHSWDTSSSSRDLSLNNNNGIKSWGWEGKE